MWLTFSNLTSPALYFRMCTLKGWTRCSIIFLPFRTCWDSKQLGNQVITFVSQPLQGSILYYLSLTLSFKERERESACMRVCMCSCFQSCPTPQTVAHQAPPFMEFSRQEYWSGLPFSSPGDLSDPEIKLGSPCPVSPALAVGLWATRESLIALYSLVIFSPCLFFYPFSPAFFFPFTFLTFLVLYSLLSASPTFPSSLFGFHISAPSLSYPLPPLLAPLISLFLLLPLSFLWMFSSLPLFLTLFFFFLSLNSTHHVCICWNIGRSLENNRIDQRKFKMRGTFLSKKRGTILGIVRSLCAENTWPQFLCGAR